MMQLPKCAERNRPQGVIFRNRRSVTVGSVAGGKMAQNMAPVRVRLCGSFHIKYRNNPLNNPVTAPVITTTDPVTAPVITRMSV